MISCRAKRKTDSWNSRPTTRETQLRLPVKVMSSRRTQSWFHAICVTPGPKSTPLQRAARSSPAYETTGATSIMGPSNLRPPASCTHLSVHMTRCWSDKRLTLRGAAERPAAGSLRLGCMTPCPIGSPANADNPLPLHIAARLSLGSPGVQLQHRQPSGVRRIRC